jgi:comEA protein
MDIAALTTWFQDWYSRVRGWILPIFIGLLLVSGGITLALVPGVQERVMAVVTRTEVIHTETPVPASDLQEKMAELVSQQQALRSDVQLIRADHQSLLEDYQAAVKELALVYDELIRQSKRVSASNAAIQTQGSVEELESEESTEEAGSNLVSLNTGTQEQLETLPGVGPKLALAIIQYRQEKGAFKSLEELDNVSGVGSALLTKLQPLVSL